jgi:xanthosine utilization system XapX-like protein
MKSKNTLMLSIGAAATVCLLFVLFAPRPTGPAVMLAGFTAILTTVGLAQVLSKATLASGLKATLLIFNAIAVASCIYFVAINLGGLLAS